MKSFSLNKLKDKVGRRFSEPSTEISRSLLVSMDRRNSHANEVIVVSEADGSLTSLGGSPTSMNGDKSQPSLSRSVSKKQAKELIRQETSHVIQKKLLLLLKDLGLQLPIPLKASSGGLSAAASKAVKIYVANTRDCIYLASSVSASSASEDAEDAGNQIPELDSSNDLSGHVDDTSSTVHSPGFTPSRSVYERAAAFDNSTSAMKNAMGKNMRALKSANYLCSQIESQTVIPHLFAVIVELKKDYPAKSVEVEFVSTTKTQWPTADSTSRNQCKEKFKIGNVEWDLAFQDADFFISLRNSNDSTLRYIDSQVLAEKTREIRLFNARTTSSDCDISTMCTNRRPSFDSIFLAHTESPTEIQKAGLYVFLLPILLPPNMPATVNTANGCLTHKLHVRFSGAHEKFSKRFAVSASYNLPMVRTPPSLANSIADKPIYVNRIWNASLHYSVAFPRRYVTLGSEHTINVKLVPLAKDVNVKRINFNILERLTYVSKDLTREYEFSGDDPFARARNTKPKERVISLCELRTNAKGSYSGTEPFKEEVLSCPGNNLLYSCYEEQSSSADSSRQREKPVMIASPLDINIALPFLTSRADKEIMTSSLNDIATDIPGSKSQSVAKCDLVASMETPSLPIIGSLETHISHVHVGEVARDDVDEDILKLESSSFLLRKPNGRSDSISRGYTSTARALSPDSNFRHIQISHRLQVSLRISKPDASDNNQMHHFEVVVETPIVLLSAKCNDDSMQLPEYDDINVRTREVPPQRPNEINFSKPSYMKNGVNITPFDPSATDQLPSFEEATATRSSPIVRSSSITSLDPATPSCPPSYEDVPYNDEVDPLLGALTIDDILIEPSRSSSQRKSSAVRLSLQNSFAASNSKCSCVSINSEASPMEDAASYNSEVISNVTTSDEFSTQSTRNGMESASSNEVESNDAVCATMSTSAIEDASASFIASHAEENQRAVTDEAQSDQRFLLLRNESTSGDEAPMTRVRLKNKRLFSDGLKKLLTDTLNEESQAQSLFHAY